MAVKDPIVVFNDKVEWLIDGVVDIGNFLCLLTTNFCVFFL